MTNPIPIPMLYGIPNCDTVKKARAWLAQAGVQVQFHDFKKQGVPPDLLDQWMAELGWATLVNRKGTTWRKLDHVAQAAIQDARSAKALMLSQPSVIKRPVVVWGSDLPTTVGFDPSTFAQTWAAVQARSSP